MLAPEHALAAEQVSALEQQWSLLQRHRVRLESLLGEHGKRISRLKAQPAGVGRDYQLQSALRESQAVATRLTQLRAQLRGVGTKLIAAYDAALATARGEAQARLRQRRAAVAAEPSGGDSRIVTRERAGRMDSPEELDEKADLLQDSEEKVRRQLKQVEAKLAQLEHRTRLERHSKAVDDSPFVEESPRRTGQARKSSSGGGAAEAAAPSAGRTSGGGSFSSGPGGKSNTPAPPPAPAAGTGLHDDASSVPPAAPAAKAPPAGDGDAARSASETVISIRDVMDPAILKDPKLGVKGEGLKARIAALKRAGERLRRVAGQLAGQAGDLRRRAKTLRTQK
jgi:hypothetical protein